MEGVYDILVQLLSQSPLVGALAILIVWLIHTLRRDVKQIEEEVKYVRDKVYEVANKTSHLGGVMDELRKSVAEVSNEIKRIDAQVSELRGAISIITTILGSTPVTQPASSGDEEKEREKEKTNE